MDWREISLGKRSICCQIPLFAKEGTGEFNFAGTIMTEIYNKLELKDRRRNLRRNQTEAEKLLWQRLRNKQLNDLKFFRQYSVGAYILDFYCPTLKLAIELDGGQHGMPEALAYDEARTKYLNELGIEVMRFWNADVIKGIDEVLMEIQRRSKGKYYS